VHTPHSRRTATQASVALLVLCLFLALWIRLSSEAKCVNFAALDASTGAASATCSTLAASEVSTSVANAECLITDTSSSQFSPVGSDGSSGWLSAVVAVLWWMFALVFWETVVLFIVNRTHRGLRHMVKRGLQASDRIKRATEHVDSVVSSAPEVSYCLLPTSSHSSLTVRTLFLSAVSSNQPS